MHDDRAKHAGAKTRVNLSTVPWEKLSEGKRRGLQDFTSPVLPEGGHVLGENTHFGWPIATQAGDALSEICRLALRLVIFVALLTEDQLTLY